MVNNLRTSKIFLWLVKLFDLFIFLWLGQGGGKRTNERPGTDHVIPGPMIGLKKLHFWFKHLDIQTDGHGNSMTKSAQWPIQ